MALKSDALWVSTSSEETDGMQDASAETTRIRLLLSGRHQRVLANDAMLSPSFELGIRYDDGDAETGFGMELGGGTALCGHSTWPDRRDEGPRLAGP